VNSGQGQKPAGGRSFYTRTPRSSSRPGGVSTTRSGRRRGSAGWRRPPTPNSWRHWRRRRK